MTEETNTTETTVQPIVKKKRKPRTKKMKKIVLEGVQPIVQETKPTIQEVKPPVEPQKPKEAKLCEWFNQHWYKSGDEYYASVTTIIGDTLNNPQLNHWRDEVGAEQARLIATAAAERGTRVHHACDALNKGFHVYYKKFEGDELYEGDVIMYDQWEYFQVFRYYNIIKNLGAKRIASELPFVDTEVGYAGTIDLIADIKGGFVEHAMVNKINIPEGRYICDIKTGKYIHDDYQYQLGAYIKAYQKTSDKKIAGGIILHLNPFNPRNENFAKIVYYDLEKIEKGFEIFDRLLYIWNSRPHVKPKEYTFPSQISF